MDDFNVSSLYESKNEWAARLVTIFTPLIIEGFQSVLKESIKLCKSNNDETKYLQTFQNLISRIPKWNPQIIEAERKRIVDKSGCNYLEDLISCVHVIQIKILTAMRVGQKQKKIDVNIPKLDDFVHKVYINSARKIYKNVYLFEEHIPPLEKQKHYRELEIVVQECLMQTIRESIPVETILKAYLDESTEEDVIEEIKEQIIESPIESDLNQKVAFNEVDYVKQDGGRVEQIITPKDVNILEEKYKGEMSYGSDNADNNNDLIQILEEPVNLDFESFDAPSSNININNDMTEFIPDELPDLLSEDVIILN